MLELVLESGSLLSQFQVLSDAPHTPPHGSLKLHTHLDLADTFQMSTQSHNTESENPNHF